MQLTVYGIANCDTVKKARAWLTAQQIDYTFHDFKKQGLDPATVAAWLAEVGRDVLVNRKGTTWRALDAQAQAGAADDAGACALLCAHPSLVKRPVLVLGDAHGPRVTVGFSPAAYGALFGRTTAEAA